MVSVMQTGRQEGMQTLDQCLKMHVDAGDISSEIAATFAVNKTLFSQG
jgi:Tfp pilus assembly pilus retraction ATPase PilT